MWESELQNTPNSDDADDMEGVFDCVFDGTDDYGDDTSENSDDDGGERREGMWKGPVYTKDYLSQTAPSIPDAHAAKGDLENVLNPWHTSGRGHKEANIGTALS